jgi:LmbE family N-acetylglucosaminyl deacetylase
MKHRILHFTLALLVLSLLLAAPRAQQSTTPSDDRIALYQALLDLQNPWTVMCVAAHPDDEDGTSLIVMRRKYGAHTVSLFSTFGEGGQNAIGPELYEEMGAIRARETMAASEIQGSEPHFLGLRDFGFSKSSAEAFKFWGHDEALRRMVLEIRKLRPDVIITNHSVTSNDHGHHQATARLLVESFDAAADPAKFPEQLKDGVTTWQVQRLFVRARGNQQPGSDVSLVTIDPNERDPIRGTVFAEQALSALQKHATQGPWPKSFAEYMARFRAFSGQGGATGQMPMVRYRLERQAKSSDAVPKDSHNFLDGLRLPDAEASLLTQNFGRSLTELINDRPALLNALLAAKKSEPSAKGAPKNYTGRVERQRSLLDQAISQAAGLEVSMSPKNAVVVPGTSKIFSVTVSNHGNLSPWVIATYADAGDSRVERFIEITDKSPHQVMPGKSERLTLSYYSPPAKAPITIPNYAHLYDGNLFSQIASMGVSLKVEGVAIVLNASTRFDIASRVDISNISPSPLVIRPDEVRREQRRRRYLSREAP